MRACCRSCAGLLFPDYDNINRSSSFHAHSTTTSTGSSAHQQTPPQLAPHTHPSLTYSASKRSTEQVAAVAAAAAVGAAGLAASSHKGLKKVKPKPIEGIGREGPAVGKVSSGGGCVQHMLLDRPPLSQERVGSDRALTQESVVSVIAVDKPNETQMTHTQASRTFVFLFAG
eukprot:GHVQ01028360.1.p1 GENE.GHVQ01028360.1~~GHVQ01028360.1.p1  ORF type:complete len:172 (+),score=48.76 GHVQ01028360.1:308-823(+)